jgi:NAD(P)-dependent dehydrogenase (short-subunit alcohol dehydrogenase family)
VILVDRDEARLNETLAQITGSGGKAIAVVGDVSDETLAKTEVERAVAEFGRVPRACICGSNLWPYKLGPALHRQPMGHEPSVSSKRSAVPYSDQARPRSRNVLRLFQRELHVLLVPRSLMVSIPEAASRKIMMAGHA